MLYPLPPVLRSLLSHGITWNGTLLVNIPLGVATGTYPVVAPAGTFAVRYVWIEQ